MTDGALAAAFAADIAALSGAGGRFVVVHGGGPQITDLLGRLRVESRFVDGLRVTDAETMRVVEMALCGEVNKAVVSAFAQRGVRAVGLSGRDGGLLRAVVKNPALGLVGQVRSVDAAVLECLLNGGFTPVVAPVGAGPEGQALNINADTAAGAIAGALKAAAFVLVSDVPGVLGPDKSLLPSLDRAGAERLRAEGVISGGMIPKVEACLHALDAGCGSALILDGRAPSSLRRFLTAGEPLGTRITSRAA
jgi:acetylglutamate kinase